MKYHSFIHFLFILIQKAINIYILICSEAVPQRCSRETDAPRNARENTHAGVWFQWNCLTASLKSHSHMVEFAGALRLFNIRSPRETDLKCFTTDISESDLQKTKKTLSSSPGCTLLFWKISKDCNGTSKVVLKTTPSGLN